MSCESESTNPTSDSDQPRLIDLILDPVNVGFNRLAQEIFSMHQDQREFISKEINSAKDEQILIMTNFFNALVKDYERDLISNMEQLTATIKLKESYDNLMKVILSEFQQQEEYREQQYVKMTEQMNELQKKCDRVLEWVSSTGSVGPRDAESSEIAESVHCLPVHCETLRPCFVLVPGLEDSNLLGQEGAGGDLDLDHVHVH